MFIIYDVNQSSKYFSVNYPITFANAVFIVMASGTALLMPEFYEAANTVKREYAMFVVGNKDNLSEYLIQALGINNVYGPMISIGC